MSLWGLFIFFNVRGGKKGVWCIRFRPPRGTQKDISKQKGIDFSVSISTSDGTRLETVRRLHTVTPERVFLLLGNSIGKENKRETEQTFGIYALKSAFTQLLDVVFLGYIDN